MTGLFLPPIQCPAQAWGLGGIGQEEFQIPTWHRPCSEPRLSLTRRWEDWIKLSLKFFMVKYTFDKM